MSDDLLARATARINDPDAAGCEYGDCKLIAELADALRKAWAEIREHRLAQHANASCEMLAASLVKAEKERDEARTQAQQCFAVQRNAENDRDQTQAAYQRIALELREAQAELAKISNKIAIELASELAATRSDRDVEKAEGDRLSKLWSDCRARELSARTLLARVERLAASQEGVKVPSGSMALSKLHIIRDIVRPFLAGQAPEPAPIGRPMTPEMAGMLADALLAPEPPSPRRRREVARPVEVDHEPPAQTTHFVGDDCPGGHEEEPHVPVVIVPDARFDRRLTLSACTCADLRARLNVDGHLDFCPAAGRGGVDGDAG